MTVLDHPAINQRYFFPRPSPLPGAFQVDCGDAVLSCYFHRPFPKAKTLVHFHGNGEIVADYIPGFVEAVAERTGLNCFLAEYRGYGASTGIPLMVTMLGDVKPIIEAIGLPPEELILFGRSVGSLYAVHGASLFGNIAGLVIESGIADSMERILMRVSPADLDCTMEELEAEVDAHLNHRRKLEGYTGPALVMHTRVDGIVDVSHGERLYQWAAGPKDLIIFEEGNHNSILGVNADAYFQALKRFAN
ncbi:MAG: alpha/beta hydrolase [Acidobacteriota bacterium]|nr:alpha/beta hydrolase [Acidobacteriota bacterium]